MKIRFVQSCSTDGPSYAAGNTYDVSKADAQGFIKAGLAVPAVVGTETRSPSAVSTSSNSAAVPLETAAQRRARVKAEREAAKAAKAKAAK